MQRHVEAKRLGSFEVDCRKRKIELARAIVRGPTPGDRIKRKRRKTELSRRYRRASSAFPLLPRIPPTVSRNGRRSSAGPFVALCASRRRDQASPARRTRRTVDHNGVPTKGPAHPAAHSTAAAGNSGRSVRSIGVHPERPFLRPLALVGYSDLRRCEELPLGGARPCEPEPLPL